MTRITSTSNPATAINAARSHAGSPMPLDRKQQHPQPHGAVLQHGQQQQDGQ
jgi:hypothetical protein